ncbi:MAG: flagellar hook-length control protein FliK [Burkholderiales bacterium]|nr:flagellar hook-length control protein FliK [Burkholderiales bacterium]
MTTPVHLSGPRPSTSASASPNSSAQSTSVATSGRGAQVAMFDLLFALQLGAGGWGADANGDPALNGDAGDAAREPTLPIVTSDPATAAASTPAQAVPPPDPAALLWNPFSERTTTVDASPVATGIGADTAAAVGSTDDSARGRSPSGGAVPAARPDATGVQSLNSDAEKTAAASASGADIAPREYSQAQSGDSRDASAAARPASAHAPTAAATAPPPAPTTVATLDAPMGTSTFREQLATQIAVFIDQKQLSAQIQVHPPELGPVDVEIKIKADAVDVGFFATQADARDALELAIPQLKEMLAEQGLSLGSAHVGTRDDSRGFADTLQDGWRGSGRRDASASASAGAESAGSAESAEPVPLTIRRSLRLVDTFA